MPRRTRPTAPSRSATRFEPLETRRLLSAVTAEVAASTYDIGYDGQYDQADAVAAFGDGFLAAGSRRTSSGPRLVRLTSTAADGTPDASFGDNGAVEFSVFGAASFDRQYPNVTDVEVGANGDIYVAGFVRTGFSGNDSVQHLFVQRLNADGTLAAGWNADLGGGVFSVNTATGDDLRAEGTNPEAVMPKITVLGDGSVLLGGAFNSGADNGALEDSGDDALVVKFGADGTIDSGFGNAIVNGQAAFVGTYDNDYAYPQYSSTFNYIEDEEVRDLTVLDNGDIALFLEVEGDSWDGQNDRYAAVAMLTADGQRVTGFGNNGLSVIDSEIEEVIEVGATADGGYALGLKVMQQWPGTTSSLERGFGVMKLDAGFALDTSYGTGGITTAQFSASDTPGGIAIDPRGGVVMSGVSESRPVAIRFDDAGALDTAFGTDGRAFMGDAGYTQVFDAAVVGEDTFGVVGFTDALSGGAEVDAQLGVVVRTPEQPPEPPAPTVDVTFDADTGTLLVVGNDDAEAGDDLLFSPGATADEVVITSGGTEVGTYSGVAAIDVDLLAGDDRIVIGEGVLIPATVAGGTGNDFIVGGDAGDSLDGGDGNDVLDGGAGDYDDLFGGAGDDFLFDADGVDDVDGGLGDDAIDLTFHGGWVDTFFGRRASIGLIRGGLGNDLLRITAAEGDGELRLVVMGDNLWRGGADGDDTMLYYGDYARMSVMLPDSVLGSGDADYATGNDSLYAGGARVLVLLDRTWVGIEDPDDAAGALDDLYDAYDIPPEDRA